MTPEITKEDLINLPYKSRLAFCARCCRRLQPTFNVSKEFMKKEKINLLDDSILLVELIANSNVKIENVDINSYISKNLEILSEIDFESANPGYNVTCMVIGTLMYAKFKSNSSMIRTTNLRHYDGNILSIITPIHLDPVAYHSVAAAIAFDSIYNFFGGITLDDYSGVIIKEAIKEDYTFIEKIVKRNRWNEESPVDPTFFGPLWLSDEPDIWPVKNEKAQNSIEMECPNCNHITYNNKWNLNNNVYCSHCLNIFKYSKSEKSTKKIQRTLKIEVKEDFSIQTKRNSDKTYVHLRNQIGEGKTNEVFKELKSFLLGKDKELFNEVIVLSSQNNDIEKKKRMNMLSEEDKIKVIQINFSLLLIIEKVEERNLT